MNKQFLLLSMIASSGAFADIDWLDEHEPCYEEYVNIFVSYEDFNLNEYSIVIVDSEEEKDQIAEDLAPIAEDVFVVVDFEIEDEPGKEIEKKIESPKEEIHFVLRDPADKLPINEEKVFVSKGFAHKMPIESNDSEIAYQETDQEDSPLVEIGEIGPFSKFLICGKSTKLAVAERPDEDFVPELEMIYFAPQENSSEAYYLSPNRVTNREYEKFVKATHHRPPPHWPMGEAPPGYENDPVVNVTYKDAFLYSVWAGKRLPKESELIHAAKVGGDNCVMDTEIGEWTSTPSVGKNGVVKGAAHLTINSELSRITYHKVFLGDYSVESEIHDSNHYNNVTGFRVASNNRKAMN
jgi:hypothetical protein